MNFNPSEQEEINIWKDREKLPKMSVWYTLVIAAICAFCALALPLCMGSELFSLAVLAVLFVYVVFSARAAFPVTLILVSAVLITGVTTFAFGFSLGALFLATVVGTTSLATLLTVFKYPYPALLLPILGAGISCFFLSDWRMAVVGLLFVPAAVFLAFATRMGRPRTGAILFTVCGFLLTVLAAAIAWIWTQNGSVSREIISNTVSSLHGEWVEALKLARDDLIAIATADPSENAQALNQLLSENLTDTAITELVTDIIRMIPAFIVIVCSVVAFEAQLLLNATYRTIGFERVLTRDAQTFTVRVMTAIIYALTFLLVLFLPDDSMAYTVIQNVCLMLMPALCVMGVLGFLQLLFHANSGTRMFAFLCLAFLFCCSSGSALFILAMWGAYTVVMAEIRKKMGEYIAQNGGDSSDPPNDE